MARALRPPNTALTVLAGDFNYAAREGDRFSKATAQWAGLDEDTSEETSFLSGVANPFGLYEVEQDDYTHDCALGRSRIDRVYVNQHVTDQLDRQVGCAALAWCPELSAHRPIAFYRRSPQHEGQKLPPLPQHIFKKEDWKRRVILRLGELECGDYALSQPIRRLVLAKRAIREVSSAMAREEGICEPES